MRLQPQVFLHAFSMLLVTSCCPEVTEEIFLFNIEGIEPLNFNHNSIQFIEGSGNDISASTYAIVIQTNAPEVRKARPQSRGGGIFRSPDCSGVVDPILQLEDQVSAITITATEEFSESYPIGADLSGLFRTIFITMDNPFSPSRIEDNLIGLSPEGLNWYLIRHHDVVDYRKQNDALFYGLKLLQQPVKPVVLQFKLELTF